MKIPYAKRLAALVLAFGVVTAAAASASASVADIKPGNWAYEAVQYNIENKLIAVDYGQYDMDAPAPRQDVAYALYKLTNGKDTEPTACPTVPEDMKNAPDKYKYSVQWAVQNDVIKGTRTEGGRVWFSPNQIIDREQMATLLFRLAKHDGLSAGFNPFIMDLFSDFSSISSWAREAMLWCVSNGIMNGTGGSKLEPKTTLSSGQLAQFMLNYGKFKAMENEPPAPSPDPTPTPPPSTFDPDYHPSYYNLKALPVSDFHDDGKDWPARQDYNWLIVNSKSSGFWQNITDLSGPWDNCKPMTDWLPEGGYKKDGHRYNKYGVCIDKIDGIPTDDEKKAFITINQHRVNQGLYTVEWDQALQIIAEIRSLEQNVLPSIAHTRPDGISPRSIIDECLTVGALSTKPYIGWMDEDLYPDLIYSDYCNTSQAIQAFIKSKGHNDSFLSKDTTHSAISDVGGNTCYYGLELH